MKQELSILIPVYNNICTTMVEQLSLQATVTDPAHSRACIPQLEEA